MLSKASVVVVVLALSVGAVVGLSRGSFTTWFATASAPKEPSTPITAPGGTAAAQPGDCVDGFWLGNGLEDREKAERVVRACSAAIQARTLSPAALAEARLNRATARTALGNAILASGDYLEALRHYQAAIDPMNPDALQLYRMGAASSGLGDTDSAVRHYDRAIRTDPKLALAYYGRGVLLATRERALRRAIGDFDKVLLLEPTNVRAFIWRGTAFSQVGDFGYALADLNRALEIDPSNPAAFVARGLVNDRRGRSAEALQDFEAALRLNPRNASAMRNRGAVYAKLGQFNRAIEDFDAVIAVAPNDPISFYDRGYAYFGKKDYELAVIDYGTAIFLNPSFGAAYLNRCLTLAIQGQELVKALADCDRALKLLPASIVARETRGLVYLKLGDPAIAVTEYEAALQIDPNRARALYGLGLAKQRMGREAEGKTDQAAALALLPSVNAEFSEHGVD